MQGCVRSRRRGWLSPLRLREAVEAYVLLTPMILGLLLFTIGPILYSFYLSFTEYEILSPPVFIGLRNYLSMASDDLFWTSLKVTTIYTAAAVPLGVITGYLLALLLNQRVAGLSVWRMIFYVPSVVPALASAYLFLWLFNSEMGLVNAGLRAIGIVGPKWFASREWVLPSYLLMGLWGAGGGMILYLAALQGVPTELYEAAMLDGAGAWRKFVHVTIPMTSPVIFFTTLMGIIGTFQIFTAGYVMTGGGPGNASLFYCLNLYRQAWGAQHMGYGAALAWVLFVIIMTLTVITMRVSGRLVYYGGEL